MLKDNFVKYTVIMTKKSNKKGNKMHRPGNFSSLGKETVVTRDSDVAVTMEQYYKSQYILTKYYNHQDHTYCYLRSYKNTMVEQKLMEKKLLLN